MADKLWYHAKQLDEKHRFWKPIKRAFDLLAHGRYSPGSFSEIQAGFNFNKNEIFDEGPIIKLDQGQARIVDALVDTFNLPHEKRARELVIPEKLRDYEDYEKSQEYKDRVAQYRATAGRKKQPE